ncbi:hypothetical protein niasHS_007812 [Heterodera schachtii]|uniref:1-alkyl-2-acetylglycerophosphocholine esterase n=1 Tax=Heterodera schachtii TaxID=97005 RepID=A0ABD2JQA3_HETSC
MGTTIAARHQQILLLLHHHYHHHHQFPRAHFTRRVTFRRHFDASQFLNFENSNYTSSPSPLSRDGSCCWTYTLEQVPAPPPTDAPKIAKKPSPARKAIEMRVLGPVKRRVAETVHMRRILAEMDANLLQKVTTDNNNDRQFGQQQILLGQTFDWAQFKNRLALDRCVAMGHSFGGASTLSACAEYPSLFNACVLLDAWLFPVERRMYPATERGRLLLLDVYA